MCSGKMDDLPIHTRNCHASQKYCTMHCVQVAVTLDQFPHNWPLWAGFPPVTELLSDVIRKRSGMILKGINRNMYMF